MELKDHTRPIVSVIVINYNTFDLTVKCIRSVIEHTSVLFEIVLVDNASTECNPDLFLEKFPAIQLIKSSINLGFSGGNNLGLTVASGEYILLLNSDTYLTEDSITKTISFIKTRPDIAVAGCRMIYPEGNPQKTARYFRSISWELLDLFRPVLYLLPYKKRATLMLGKYFKANFSCYCDWVNGAFFLFPSQLLALFPSGKLDDRFFMYAEDHLWCWQIAEKGYKTFFYSDTTIVHINNGSTDLSKRINLLRTMFNHELEIMRERKGTGLYYFFFRLVYGFKEQTRIFIKKILFWFTGKLMR